MPYCEKSDILQEIDEAELIGLTDDAGAGSVDDGKISAAIAKADALIDSYCGQVETVPFTNVPGVIKQHSVTIALYFLFSRRNAVPENRKEDYDRALSHLKDIAAGRASLPIPGEDTGGDEISIAGPDGEVTAEDRIFKKDNMGSF